MSEEINLKKEILERVLAMVGKNAEISFIITYSECIEKGRKEYYLDLLTQIHDKLMKLFREISWEMVGGA
jgi:hypothetical protein